MTKKAVGMAPAAAMLGFPVGTSSGTAVPTISREGAVASPRAEGVGRFVTGW